MTFALSTVPAAQRRSQITDQQPNLSSNTPHSNPPLNLHIAAAAAAAPRGEALAIGNVYTQLIGEFGRAVGNGLTAIETLGRGGLRFLNPLALGVDALELHLNSLIVFLQEAASPSVSGPGRALTLAPFIGECALALDLACS
jgi:hypothetical protein